MVNTKRRLTQLFEPGNNDDDDDQGDNYASNDTNIPLVKPSVNVVPPQDDEDNYEADNDENEVGLSDREDNDTTDKESGTGNIFKNQGNLKIGRARPKLTLHTGSFSNESTKSTGRSKSFSSLSGDLFRGRSRRRSNSSNNQDKSTSPDSNTYSDRPPRSARILSYIAAEDMDEFHDIEKDFQSALDTDGLTWLPQLGQMKSRSSTGSLADNDQDSNRAHDHIENTAHVGSKISENESLQPDVGHSNVLADGKNGAVGLALHSPVRKEDARSFFDKSSHVEVSSFEVEVANFDEQEDSWQLYGNSLGIISPKNPIRLKLAALQMNEKFKYLMVGILSLFTCFMAYRTYKPHTNILFSFSNWADVINFLICVLFTLSDISKIIAFGFWDDSEMFAAYGKKYVSLLERFGIVKLYLYLKNKYGAQIIDTIVPIRIATNGEDEKFQRKSLSDSWTEEEIKKRSKKKKFEVPRAFARSSWNRIDLTSTICFWIALFLTINDYDRKNGIRIFKTLAVLRILRLVNTDTGLSSILRGIKQAVPQLINVGTMLVYFWVLFGILGVQSFRGSFRRQCVWTNPNDPTDKYTYDMQFCGGHLDPVTGAPRNYIFADGSEGPTSKGFLCPRNSQCVSDTNPFNGRVSFDNIINAMELVFVIMSANTFTDLMYYTMDSDEMAASLFFIVAIFVLTIWMMNLLIAVLVSSFQLANERFKKKKLDMNSVESWPVRLTKGYWRYFQVKARNKKFPAWARKGLFFFNKVNPLFVALIAVDAILRCFLDAKVSESFTQNFFKIDLGICSVLFVESIFRLIFHLPNIWRFLTEFSYIYDLVISILTLIISALKLRGNLGHSYYWLSILHISRLYRVIFFFGFTSNLWRRVLGNGIMIWNLSAFYFFFTFLVSIIMSVFFEGVIPESEQDDQSFGMYSLPNSFLSLFIIGSTENWTDILYELQSYAFNMSSSFLSSVLLIIWFILSNSVILNIFIALISETMEVKEEDKRPLQIKHYLKYVYPQKIKDYTHATLLRRIRKKFLGDRTNEDSKDFKQFLIRGTAIMNIAQNMGDLANEFRKDENPGGLPNWLVVELGKVTKWFSFMEKLKMYTDNPFYKSPKVIFNEGDDGTRKTFSLELDEYEDEKLEYLKKHPSFNYTYFILPPRHKFRKFCQRLVPPSVGRRTDGIQFYDDGTDEYGQKFYFRHIERDFFVLFFSIITLLLIVFSCYVTPLRRMQDDMRLWGWSTYIDVGFVCILSLEFLVKTVADGVIYTPNAYLRNPWNIIDFIVLVSMWINFIAFVRNNGNLSRIFRGLTALRALRCLTISNMARQTFNMVVFDGIKKIFEATFVSLTLLFPFTIWGMNIFRGRLGTCTDNNVGKNDCYNEFTNSVFQWDVMMPRVYQQPYLYLDSFGSALRSMYEIVSLEGWVDLLENLMNSTGIGTVTSTFASPGNAVFLVLFNFLSMVFILNLFVSFIINNHAKTTGSAYYTLEEKSWLESQKLLSQAKPKAAPSLEIFHFYGEGFRLYVRSKWNVLRFGIVLTSFVLTAIGFSFSDDQIWFSNIKELFHLVMFLLIIPQNDTLSELAETAAASWPPILSLTYTWAILFLVYSIALNQIFGTTRLGANTTDNINFRTVIKSLIVLFRCSFGEGWNYIMDDLTVSEPYCSSTKEGSIASDCGSRTYAYILLMSWNIVSMYIFLNMFISLIIGNFSYVYRRGGSNSAIDRREVLKYTHAWAKYDSDGTGYLEFSHLPKLMHSFSGPLSFRIWEGRHTIPNLVKNYMKINPDDPYDVEVDLQGLNKELNLIDWATVAHRRLQYRRFFHEVVYTNSYWGAIRFSSLLQLIPLYTTYNPRECLGIDEYVHYLYNMGKVDKILDTERNLDILNMVVTCWKYCIKNKRRLSKNADDIRRQTIEVPTNPFSDDFESDSGELNFANTPSMDFGVDNFMWSPRKR
ncbi:calcium channel protein [Zygosaccharomyces mellis]|uniref:Calcium-channel protein CCH1 n=1 Tax=Zygosaccharomyces mellis TaxID=42258 RepID=A0A4C2E8F8_9SACH|nr:calcium channel protein [Zygosaccharomyces mellis]